MWRYYGPMSEVWSATRVGAWEFLRHAFWADVTGAPLTSEESGYIAYTWML